MKHCLYTLCLLILSFVIKGADSTGIISGRVYDINSSEPLFGTTIIYRSNQGTSTDLDGYFQIKTNSGNINLTIQFVGYKTVRKSVHLKPNDTTVLDIGMHHEVTEIDQIVVSANKVEQRVSELTVSVSVLKPEMLSKNHITNAQELINKSSGIEVLDGQASIRGGSGFSYGAGSRVLALIDGLPVLSADAGNIKWQFLPLENLSQIEIIKGASSVLYGSSALNGIINFRTADALPADPVTKFFVETGVFGKPKQKNWVWWDQPRTFSNASFSHLQKYGRTDIAIAGSLMADRGYRKLNNENLGRINFKLKHNSQNIEGLQYGVNLNAGLTEKRDFIIWEDAYRGALKQDESSAMLLYGSLITVDPFISLKRNDRIKHDLRMRFQKSGNHFPDNSQNNSDAFSFYSEYQLWYKLFSFMNLNAGISENYSKIISGFYGDHAGINLAGYAQADISPLNRIKFVAGLRMEYNALDGIKDKLVPLFRTGINYKVLDYTFLRASFGQGYRYPAIAEKFASTTLGSVKIFPNPAIQPESGWNSEIGIKQGILTPNLNGQADFAVFYTQNLELIEFIFSNYPDPVTGIYEFGFKATNVEQSRVYGCELEFFLNSNMGLFQNTIGGGYVYMFPVEFSPVTKRNTDVFLKYRRKHSGKLDLTSIYNKFEIGTSLYIKSKILNIDDVFLSETTRESILPGFYDYWTNNNTGHFLLDMNFGYNILKDKYKISVALKNVTNTEYMGRPGDIMPHRNISLRISGRL